MAAKRDELKPIWDNLQAQVDTVWEDRKKAEEEKARKSVGSVKGDGRRIKESGAVKGARGLLGLEEGKRVRVVEPERR